MSTGTRRALIAIAVTLAILYVISALKAVIVPLFVAFVIAYASDPLLTRMAKRIGRTMSVIFVMLLMLLAAFLLINLIIPMIQSIILTFTMLLPTLLEKMNSSLAPILARAHIKFPGTVDQLIARIAQKLSGVGSDELQTAGSAFSWAFSGTVGVISFVLVLVLIPFFSYYMMLDYSKIITTVYGLIPQRYMKDAEKLSKELDYVMSHYIRGQLTVCIVMGLLYATSLMLFHVENGFGIGILAGLLNVVPYGGIIVGVILSVSFSFLNFTTWTPVIGSLITFTVLPMFDNFFVTPKILGKSVGMNPVFIVVALLVGGNLLGIFGLIIAVPAAAIIRVLLKIGLEYYHSSEAYKGTTPPAA